MFTSKLKIGNYVTHFSVLELLIWSCINRRGLFTSCSLCTKILKLKEEIELLWQLADTDALNSCIISGSQILTYSRKLWNNSGTSLNTIFSSFSSAKFHSKKRRHNLSKGLAQTALTWFALCNPVFLGFGRFIIRKIWTIYFQIWDLMFSFCFWIIIVVKVYSSRPFKILTHELELICERGFDSML